MSSSTSSSRRRRSLAPLFVALGVAFSATVGWRAAEPLLPPVVERVDDERGPLRWGEGHGGPFHCREDLEASELLVVGDSRAYYGLYLHHFESAGLGRCALYWGAAAPTLGVLEAIRHLPPRRLLVPLSPLGLTPELDRVRGSLAVVDPPDTAGPDGYGDVTRWGKEWYAVLVDEGFAADAARAVVARWVEQLHDEVASFEATTQNLDKRLDRWAVVRLERLVRTVITRPWPESWFEPVEPEKHFAGYRFRLREETRPDRERELESLVRVLGEMQSAGWEIVCLRLPVSPEIFALEDAALPSERLSEACTQLGVPYLDESRAKGFETSDGSHMTVAAGERFSAALALRLAEVTDWAE